MFEIIISAIIGVGIFFGGFWVGQNTKPTQQITDVKSTTYITTEQKTQVDNFQVQAQYTVIDTKGTYTNININVKDITNSVYSFQTNTNYTLCKTN